MISGEIFKGVICTTKQLWELSVHLLGEKKHSAQHSKKQRGTGRDKHHSTPLHLDTVVKLSDKLPIKCPLGTYF